MCWLRISEDSTAHTRLITIHILAKLHSHHYPGSGLALASAGPDWKHFCGALLSGVCRNFWGETSSHNDRNQWCERARPKCATPSKGGLGASHSFTSPAETSMDNAVTLNKSYTQCFPSGRLRVVKHNGKSSQNIEGSISHDTERVTFLHTCNSYAVVSIKTSFISNVFANLRLPHPAQKLWGQKIWLYKMFDFRRITLFCLENASARIKWLYFLKIWVGPWSLWPSWLRLWPHQISKRGIINKSD